MALNSRAQTYQQVGQLSSAIVGGVLLSLVGQRSTPGQIVPDSTLGAESSVVMPNVEVQGAGADRIDGGAQRGANLFHSFDQFGVENLQRVYFSNPAGVENILSRVTGANPSHILGTLGVDGGANLYLVNPRGIVFGPDARLDVAGSFVASTAESLVLGDNLIFSAVNPGAPPVLTVNIPPGVQLGNLPTTSTLSNRGNLSVGQDLTLAAGNLDLQGQVQAGGNLTLQAADTVKIRDTVAEPFVARSDGKLLVQGDRQVDIFALNHADSGFFSGGDMTFRSANAVGGDARFWSGGNFRIEQLDRSLGGLYSPYDPVIQSQGDVFIGDYSGGSLQILAGGSVTIPGQITIFNSAPDFNNSMVLLSDDSFLTISGTDRPALDIRAGTTQFFSAPAPGTPTSADITLGNIRILNSLFIFPFGFSNLNGIVYISNKDPVNGLPGNIITGTVRIENLLPTAVTEANRSSITIDSRGDITTGNLSTRVSDGFAGNIKLLADNNINIGTTVESSVVNGSDATATGGNITLLSRNGNITTGGNVVSEIRSGSGNGGDIIFTSENGTIDTTAGKLQSQSPNGLAGNVTLTATGDISTRDIDASSNVASGFSVINLTSSNGAVIVNGGTLSTKNTGAGFAGDIRLTAATNVNVFNSSLTNDGYFGIIDLQTTGNPINSSVTVDNSLLTATVPDGLPGIGTSSPSLIRISSGKIDILNNSTLTTATNSDKANPGNITLTATANPITIRNSTVSNTVGTGKGLVPPNFANVSINGPAVLLQSSTVDTTTDGRADGATINVQATGQITISEDTDILSKVGSGATGRGGDITITGGSVAITGTGSNNPITNVGTQINASFASTATTPATGVGGRVNITATSGTVDITNQAFITTQVSGNGIGGDVTIAGPTTNLTDSQITTTLTSTATGTGGNITIGNAQTSAINLQNTTLRSNADGTGNSGKVEIRANQSVAITGGFVGTQAAISNTTGVAGDVLIQSNGTGTNAIQLNNTGIDAASFSSDGKSGNVRILAANRGDVTLIGGGSTIFTDTFGSQPSEELRIFGGNIIIDNYKLDAKVDQALHPSVVKGNGANIVIDGNAVEIRNNSRILTVTNAQQAAAPSELGNVNGKGGNITILSNLGGIAITSDSELNASTNGIKDGGNIFLFSNGGNIQFTNGRVTTKVNAGAVGAGGDIIANSGGGAIIATSNSTLDASTSGHGLGGRISLLSGNGAIQLLGGSIQTTVNPPVNPADLSGNGGNITLNSSGGEITIGTTTSSFEINSGTAATNTTGTAEQNGKGGSIAVTSAGGNISLNQATLTAQTSGTKNGGTVTIDANTGAVTVAQASRVLTESTNAATSANAGDLTLITSELDVQGGSEISAATIGLGNAGDLTVRGNGVPTNAITLTGNSFLRVNAQSGNAGAIVLDTRSLFLNNAEITASTTTGVGQDIRITNLENLTAINGEISASTNSGNAGNLLLNQGGTAANAVTLTNSTLSVAANQPRLAIGFGNAGDILLNTQQLTLTDSAVSATTVNGAAGSLNVSADGGAADFIRLNGGSELSLSATDAGGIGGTAGGITLNTRELTLTGTSDSQRSTITASTTTGTGQNIVLTNLNSLAATFGEISASTNSGNAGNLLLNQGGTAANAVTLTNSTLSVAANQPRLALGFGNAGDILLNTQQLTLNDSAVFASTVNGAAGSLNVSADGGAADSIRLTGDSQLSLSAGDAGGVGGTAGGITLNTRELTLAGTSTSQRSTITASTTTGTGQNIVLTNLNSLAATFGEISASTNSGNAGNLLLNQGGTAANAITLTNSNLSVAANQPRLVAGFGNAGDILLNTQQLTLTDSAVSAATVNGAAGSLNVSANGGAADFIRLTGDSQLSLSAGDAGGVGGTAGGITLNTRELTLAGNSATQRSTITASTTTGTGQNIILTNLNNLSATFGEISTSTTSGTAGSLLLNQGSPAANAITLSNSRLLTQAGSGIAGDILLNARQLTVQDGSDITASTTGSNRAGNFTVNADGATADLVALLGGGQINLQASGSGDGGTVSLNTRQLTLQGSSANSARISTSATSGTGGDIVLQNLRTASLDNGQLSTSTVDGGAGKLTVNEGTGPADAITLQNGSQINLAATGTGNAGQVLLNTRQLTLQGSPTQASTIAASTNSGAGGGVVLQGLSTLQLQYGEIAATTQTGIAGNLTVNGGGNAADLVNLDDRSLISLAATGDGQAGNIALNTRQLRVANNSEVSASTAGSRPAGNLTVNANGGTAETIDLLGGSSLTVSATGTGNAGQISLQAGQITVQGSPTQASTIAASTNAGTSGGVLLQGSALQMNNGEISASTQSGVAGNVSIEATNSVEMSNGSVLRVNSNSGEAGNLTINTGRLFVDPSFISAETETGRAGNVTINAAQSVQIVDNSEVSVRANQTGGSAGNLTINTAALTIDQQSRLTAETRGGTSDGANITITIPDATFPDATFPGATLNPLLIRNGSKITANAFGAANGGNVRITAPFIIGIPAEDSDITSNAEQGNGGRVSITSFGVFGLQFRRRLTPFSDITASSNVGQQGVVSIQTLGIDPSRGLNTLPAVPNDPTKQVAQGCGPVASDSAGRFTVSGRGGLPPTPEEAPTTNAVWEDVPDASPTTATFPVPTTTVAQVITQTPDTSSSTQPPDQVCHVR